MKPQDWGEAFKGIARSSDDPTRARDAERCKGPAYGPEKCPGSGCLHEKPRARRVVTDDPPLVKRAQDTFVAGVVLLGIALGILLVVWAMVRG
jgi:hypothetical protein